MKKKNRKVDVTIGVYEDLRNSQRAQYLFAKTKSHNGFEMQIVEYRSSSDITVKFLDGTEYQTNSALQNFKRGSIKNPYEKSVYGAGYLGEGVYKSRNGSKFTPQYYTWRGMVRRCYYEDRRYVEPSYWDCKVCDEWLNFQIFAKWYDENFYDVGEGRMHLDKDILIKNNRLYSPKTCIFVPQKINMLFTHPSKKDGLPTGVTKSSTENFRACYNATHLGTFKDVDLAIKAYNAAKKEHIMKLANQYKDRIPERIYNILLQY